MALLQFRNMPINNSVITLAELMYGRDVAKETEAELRRRTKNS